MSSARVEGSQSGSGSQRHSPNMEDYLEAIRALIDAHGVARVPQVSEALHVSKPSVTAAMTKLAAEGLVRHEKYGDVELTARGNEIAADVRRRHEALWVFLTRMLGVSEETAQSEACRLEHYLSPDTSIRLIRFVDHVLGGESGEPQWLEAFTASSSGKEDRE